MKDQAERLRNNLRDRPRDQPRMVDAGYELLAL